MGHTKGDERTKQGVQQSQSMVGAQDPGKGTQLLLTTQRFLLQTLHVLRHYTSQQSCDHSIMTRPWGKTDAQTVHKKDSRFPFLVDNPRSL